MLCGVGLWLGCGWATVLRILVLIVAIVLRVIGGPGCCVGVGSLFGCKVKGKHINNTSTGQAHTNRTNTVKHSEHGQDDVLLAWLSLSTSSLFPINESR